MDDLFGGAAPYYAKHRADHGDAAIDLLAKAFGSRATVLDLGCGPGTVAIPLSERVARVLAVDPAEGMLAEGRKLGAGRPNIRWLAGDSTMLRRLPDFEHVVMGRSFHWMDRGAVLADLDELLPPGGIVALVGPTRDRENLPWEPVTERVREEFGVNGLTARGSFQASGLHHDEVLAGSPFGDLEAQVFAWQRERDMDDVIGLQLSYSYSAPARLGARQDAFVGALRAALTEVNPSGRWVEEVRTQVLLARRP
ncbi:class I SAM-dependent methyltransferase [Nonomuraea sp. NPDC050790]|uniref:class I SAM-dependent methyltransferase n=1 Tax=Nonomuraea sp. NPDC050790 TaxID=3364371 RepID=UPI0037969890